MNYLEFGIVFHSEASFPGSVLPSLVTDLKIGLQNSHQDLIAKAHYIWMNLGWQNGDRVTGMTVYIRIRDNKFWIEEDWTEDGIATDLVRAGVPKEDIVLAFHEPQMRNYTFAVAS